MVSHDDPWLLPTRQIDHPTRLPVDAGTLHGRREALFLALATAHIFATAALLLLGTRTLDLAALVTRVLPDVELPVALAMPVGVLVLPVALVSVAIASELFGRRRALALVYAGSLAALAALGLVYVTSETDLVAPALALASCSIVAQLAHVLLFDTARERMQHRQFALRLLAAAFLAQLGGWAAYAFTLRGIAPATGDAAIRALALGACVYTMAAMVLAVLPALLVTRMLATYLRVSRGERYDELEDRELEPASASSTGRIRVRLPPPPPQPAPQPREAPLERPERPERIRAYTSAEMRFFSEGDELTEAADAV